MTAFIREDGRISGTRISIYDVMDYYKRGWKADQIACMYSLTHEQAGVAMAYIDAHRADVQEEYEAFTRRTNSPEVQAIVDARAPIVKARIAELRKKYAEEASRNGAGHPG